MIYILIGIAAIIGLWGVFTWAKNTKPHTMMVQLRWVGLVLAVLVGAYLIVTGRLQFLWSILPLLAPWVGKLFKSKNAPEQTEKPTKPAKVKKLSKAEAAMILGVKPDASQSQIKKAYHKKLEEYHPDHGGDHEQAVLLQAAYDCLKDDSP